MKDRRNINQHIIETGQFLLYELDIYNYLIGRTKDVSIIQGRMISDQEKKIQRGIKSVNL